MIGRHFVDSLAALLLIAYCSSGIAATPDAVAQLQAERSIAEADQDRLSAQYELAAWRLAQLQELHDRGHASWQEVAQQEVTTKEAAAMAESAKQYLRAVAQWQARITTSTAQHPEAEPESIKLYMPGTARLVAWIPTEAATAELTRRHLEMLRSEQQSLAEIDLSAREAAIVKAQRAVDIYASSPEDINLLRRAQIRLRLAKSEYQHAQARQQSSRVVAARINWISNSLKQRQAECAEPLFSLAQTGTRFVDATCDRELTQWVATMATDLTTAAGQVAWLKHQHEASLNRIDALTSLSASAAADPGELEHAQQQAADLQRQITLAQNAWGVQQATANRFAHTLTTQPTAERAQTTARTPALADDLVASPAVVRHYLDLQRLQLQTAAGRASIQAQADFLSERAKRVERIPEHARPPQELANLRQHLQSLELQLAIIDGELQQLDREQRRFGLQVRSQQGDPYQLVQSGNGTFIGRAQFERGRELLELIGFLGNLDPLFNVSATHSYIESPIVLDCINRLSVYSPAASAAIHNPTGYRTHAYLAPPAGPTNSWEAPLAANGVPWARAALNDSWDRFCYTPIGLRRTRPHDRSLTRDVLRTSVTWGYRSYYPYGSYAFGLSRPSRTSLQSRFPPVTSIPSRRSYLDRNQWPTRSMPYSNSIARPGN
jgi:hypothetical protein